MKRLSGILFVGAVMALATAGTAQASTITCPTTGSPDRQATVTGALSCVTMGPVTGTPKAGDLAAAFGGTWFDAGHFSAGEGTNGWLTIDVTNGAFGSLPVSGTWSINPLLWQLPNARAALTFHLGGGQGDPDWFMFEIVPGVTSGTFDIVKLSGQGGGFSNIVLWVDPIQGGACGEAAPCSPAPVPEPASLLLLGTGLAAIGMRLRKRAAARS